MFIAILALIGLVGGLVAGWFDDGPAMGMAFSLVGAILGAIVGLCLMVIFNPAFFS